MSIASFSDLRHALSQRPPFDKSHLVAAKRRQAVLTKPSGSLGRLEEIAIFMAGWQECEIPHVKHPQMLVFAGNHGIAARGVSAFPAEVTAQMMANFNTGGAAINQLCKLHHIPFAAVALHLEKPTLDFTKAPAMTEAECMEAVSAGMHAVPKKCDLLLLGEMGIGNTTSATAIVAALMKEKPEDITGPGTGLLQERIPYKAKLIQEALDLHAGSLDDPLQILRHLGGRELAALIGAIITARMQKTPVLLDGFVVTAAAAVLYALDETMLDHCIAGHQSAEPAHERLLKYIKHEPLLKLGMRLGEGSGAAVAYGIVQAALATHAGMSTFKDARVSNRS